jgi:nitrate reductase gamma subunit
MLDNFLFIVFPYVAVAVFVLGAVYRYKYAGFKYSSLSSQFLEGDKLFWGSMSFHWGILIVLSGHLIAFLFPSGTLLWNAHPVRLIILEVTAFTFGLSVVVGLVSLLIRRATNERLQVVTSKMDVAILLLLLLQAVLGCWIALGYRWGSSWFASDLSPYLWSLAKFSPQIEAVSAMPHVIKFHIVGAFLILFMIPFTRLVHFLVAPLHYIGRPYQIVRWNWDRKTVREAGSGWTETRPKNN